MEICRHPYPNANAFLDCIYHSQAPCCRAPIPCRFTPPGIQGRMERVQELAGYPLNGRPSAVTMLELLYNGVALYDDLSILK